MGGAAARAAGQVGLGARACDDRTGVASASERSAASRREPLRILLHDYCGHPFQFQLAVELASRGHDVVHAYCRSNPTTPQGVDGHAAVEDRLRIRAIGLPKPISKGDFVQRFLLERRYGIELAAVVEETRPDIAVMANTPIDALGRAMRAAERVAAPCVVWVQDLLGEAALRVLSAKLGPTGRLVGRVYRHREDRLLGRAHHLIAITADFSNAFRRAGVTEDRWTVIPNWAPLDRIEPRDKVNPWSLEQGIHDKTVFLYSGSLGFKHNPSLLLGLAKALRGQRDAIVVVNSEGAAADWLRTEAAKHGVAEQLRVNGFQPFERISEVLGAADVLLAVLEPDAGVFSVPSKVLSNLCAGRPQVLAVPAENLAARIVADSGCGLVCNPQDESEFVAAAMSLLGDTALRRQMGQNARDYALRNFQIDRIADQFEAVFGKAISQRSKKE